LAKAVFFYSFFGACMGQMKILYIFMVLLIVFIIYNYIQISRFNINKPIFYSHKLHEDLRITQITDYHSNSLIDKDKLMKKIQEFNPDMIVLTGDILDKYTSDIDSALDLVRRLCSINSNVFFVIGNHELQNTQGQKFISEMIQMGVKFLDNENTLLEVNHNKINIIGLSFFADAKDYEKVKESVDWNNYTLVLSHSPNKLVSLVSGEEDLVLSGHIHGGQVRLPLIGAIIGPGQGLFPKYDKGVFKLGNTFLYIDSGLGNSFLPIRLFNRVQMSNITVKPKLHN